MNGVKKVEFIDKLYGPPCLLPDWIAELVNTDDFHRTCAAMFDGVDTDGNGTLSPDELCAIVFYQELDRLLTAELDSRPSS